MESLIVAWSTQHQTDRGDAGQGDAQPLDGVEVVGFVASVPHFDLAPTSLLPPVMRSASSQCFDAAEQLQR
jgi:hypothetical protein